MAVLRVIFDGPIQLGGQRVTEVTVEAERLVLVDADGVVLEVPADAVTGMDRGRSSRTDRMRGQHPNHGRAWTAQEEAELTRLWHQRVPLEELEAVFGRSRGAVRSALARLGLWERRGTAGKD